MLTGRGCYVPTEDFRGCSRPPAEGGSIEIRLVGKWRAEAPMIVFAPRRTEAA